MTWFHSATVDLLDELEKEIAKRRDQLKSSGNGEGTGGRRLARAPQAAS